MVFGHPEAVVTPFLGPLGAFEHPVQGFRIRKAVAGVGAVKKGNPGKGKGHTAGTTPVEEEFRPTLLGSYAGRDVSWRDRNLLPNWPDARQG
jgi:hypothetical protein